MGDCLDLADTSCCIFQPGIGSKLGDNIRVLVWVCSVQLAVASFQDKGVDEAEPVIRGGRGGRDRSWGKFSLFEWPELLGVAKSLCAHFAMGKNLNIPLYLES